MYVHEIKEYVQQFDKSIEATSIKENLFYCEYLTIKSNWVNLIFKD